MRTVINKLSFRIVLSLPFLIILLVTVGLTGYLSFRNGQNAVNDVAGQLHQEVATHIQEYLDNYLGTPYLINQLNLDAIQQGELNVQDIDELEHHLITQISHFTPVVSIAYADDQKNYIGVTANVQGYAKSIELSTKTTGYTLEEYSLDAQGNRIKQAAIFPNYDPRTCPWYQAAANAGKETWTPVYTWSSGQVGLDAVAPVFDKNGSVLGVLDTSLTLDSIGGFLRSLPDKFQGQTFIIERSGLLVASSTNIEPYTTVGNVLNRLFAFQSSDPIMRLAMNIYKINPENWRASEPANNFISPAVVNANLHR